ncbi:MAG: DNA double-strand break repair nuclease NurA [Desulfurococcaceae archaeon]
MIDYLIDFIKNIDFNKLIDFKIVKNDESSRIKLYEYIDYVVDKQIENNRVELREISIRESISRFDNIFAIDSSSRTVDTPYLFVAIGSTTCINRFRNIYIDYPDITSVFSKRNTHYRYIVLIPEITGLSETQFNELKNNGIIIDNPNGIIYDSKYSKYVVLDELRLRLENNMLEIILSDDRIRDSYIFIDGAIYYTPPVIYHYNELHSIRDKYIKEYIESWKILVCRRIELINKLYSEKNNYVIGIVKRLQRSNLLSRIDPLNISTGSLNDETYLSIYIDKLIRENSVKPYTIGPLLYNPSSDLVKLPVKRIYYFAIPRRTGLIENSLKTYVFFRAEALYNDNEWIKPIIYDTIYSGSTIPLSILLADSRARKITYAFTNYFILKTGLSRESTSFYITL